MCSKLHPALFTNRCKIQPFLGSALRRAMIRRASLHVPHEVFQEESDTHIDDITVIVIRTRNVEKLWKQPVGQHVAGWFIRSVSSHVFVAPIVWDGRLSVHETLRFGQVALPMKEFVSCTFLIVFVHVCMVLDWGMYVCKLVNYPQEQKSRKACYVLAEAKNYINQKSLPTKGQDRNRKDFILIWCLGT